MKSIGEEIEILESCHDTFCDSATRDRFNLIKGLRQECVEFYIILRSTTFGDSEDLSLRFVDDIIDLAFGRESKLHDFRPGFDQLPQDRLLADDLCVVIRICCSRDSAHQCVEIRGATNLCDLTALSKFRSDGDWIYRFTMSVELDDCVIDHLVCGAIEIIGAKDLDDICDRILRKEHAAKYRLFCLEILWWSALEFVDVTSTRGIRELSDTHGRIFLSATDNAYFSDSSLCSGLWRGCGRGGKDGG